MWIVERAEEFINTSLILGKGMIYKSKFVEFGIKHKYSK
jgi:hypothetical protein